MTDTSQPDELTRDDIVGRRRELEQKTNLSDREAEIVAFKEAGLTHQAIADKLDLEKGTVDSHAHRARVKYNLAVTTVHELEDYYE